MRFTAKQSGRGAIIALVSVLHLLALEALLRDSDGGSTPEEDRSFVSTLFFFDPPAATPHESIPPQALRKMRPVEIVVPNVPTTAANITAPNAPPESVNWTADAQRAATDTITAEEAARLKGSPFSAHHSPSEARRSSPFSGWDFASTHRIQSVPGGGLIWNFSDRCSLAFVLPLMLVGCKIGKIEARGDLFTHMHDGAAGEGARP